MNLSELKIKQKIAKAKKVKRQAKAKKYAVKTLKVSDKELDALCREVVLARDKVCQKCGGSKVLQWSHVHGRRNKHLRWDPDNSKMLCFRCHFYFWHKEPLQAQEWFETKFPERAARLKNKFMLSQRGGYVDKNSWKIILLEEKKNLGII